MNSGAGRRGRDDRALFVRGLRCRFGGDLVKSHPTGTCAVERPHRRLEKRGREVERAWKTSISSYTRLGQPCVRRRPQRAKPFSAAELNNQKRLKLATEFAKGALSDPASRARYEKAAAGTNLSAQNVAVSDFMHPPVVEEVDLNRYTGRAGEFIRIQANEGRIGAAEVLVTILGPENTPLETGAASLELDGVTWWYVARIDVPPAQALWITVTAIDGPGRRTTKTCRHVSGG